jgi:hypothetical protein
VVEQERQIRIQEFLNKNPKIIMKDNNENLTKEHFFKCKKCKWEWQGKPIRIARTKGCPICSGSSIKNHFEYRFLRILKKDKIELLSILGGHRDNILIRCLKCGLERNTYPMNYLTKYNEGCTKCKRVDKREKQKQRFLKKIVKRNDIELVSEFISSNDFVTIKCNECNKNWQSRAYDIERGIGCNSCKTSSGEKEVKRILEKYNISYISQWMEHNCFHDKKLRFDFKVTQSGFASVIEYHGKQHFEYVDFFHRNQKNYQLCNTRDEIKKKYCEKRKLPYLEIRYDDENIEKTILEFFKNKKNKNTKILSSRKNKQL